MSLDPTANLQIFSPTGSGRSSPSPRATRHNTAEALSKKDKGFRRYAAGVERALALWDAAQQEWADYISFLGRLLKALQTHPTEVPAIPHSDAVALRLAQCLNPTLPSGVHQKALEVYGYIFATIRKDALSRDLNLWFPGLASVLSFASLSVRPLFLSLVEDFILKLDGAALRPALKAIILCLLPGLEDETSEDFERIVAALDKLRNAVRSESESDEIADAKIESGSSHFWQCFFLATITNVSRRQGALAYLVRRLPRFAVSNRRASLAPEPSNPPGTLPTEAEAAISPEPGLLIRCFEAGLSDSQLLIQRGFLDLLVSHLPLDSPVLQKRIDKKDLERLVGAAAGVVSRREMGLNRRLWAWFLGPDPPTGVEGAEVASPTQERGAGVDPSSAYHAAYFSQYGLEALTLSVMKLINRPSSLPSDRARPFRICLSLMDRGEVGGFIVPEVFLPALQSIQSYSEIATKDQVDEVLRSASNFFDGVESGLIWGKLIYLVTSALATKSMDRQEALRRMRLAKFILARFNLKEEEMLVHHMPLMILSILATLNMAFDDATGKTTLEKDVVELAFEIADFVVQAVPIRALRDQKVDEASLSSMSKVPREAVFKKIRAFYEENQGNLDICDAPFTAVELGQFILRESSRMFSASVQSGIPAITPEMPSKILSTLVLKIQNMRGLGKFDIVSIFQEVLSAQAPPSQKLPFEHLVAITTVLCALQTARPTEPYVEPSRLPELMQPLVSSLWDYLSPVMPKYHVEAVHSILQLHTISTSTRCVEAAISSIIVQQTISKATERLSDISDSGRRFAILWTHTMYELSLQTEKRGSISRRSSAIGIPVSSSSFGDVQYILTRPLLLLLDSLSAEGTELGAFMRSWLQDLPTLNKVFEILTAHLQALRCLAFSDHLAPGKHLQPHPSRKQTDDTKECLYYLRHIHNILKHPSQYTWATLAEEPAPAKMGAPAPKMSMQEWIVRTCIQVLGFDNVAAEPMKSHLQELSQTSVSIISQIYQGPYAVSLRDLELEVPLLQRLKRCGPSLQRLLLEATLLTLRIRLIPPEDETNVEQKPAHHPGHRSRTSIVDDRSSVETERDVILPPPQLVECLKYGFSSPSSRLVLDDWVHFLTEVLPLFTDTIFQNLLPLVECLCKQINQTFNQLKGIFSALYPVADISPESTLISLINGLEQILAKAHDRLRIQETKSTASKSPEQPQGFFGNMVSGVFASESNQTRTPTANSRLTVLLCFQDTVRICFAIWSWGGYGSKDARPDPTSAASFGYTSLRMRNRARRILEHLFAAEALECLETLVVTWSNSSKDDTQATAVMGLLNVLNGSKPKHTIPAIFNALYSRTSPNALDNNRMSTLTQDLADTDLVAFLVEYTKSLEDDAMDEIWNDCSLFLRDVLANPLPHRQILPGLLEFTAVIGQKVDNTNFGEQRKMRKDLADIFTRILTAVFTTRSMGFLQEPSHSTSEKASATATNGGHGPKRTVDVVSILTSIVPHLPTILVDDDRVTAVVSSISTSVISPTIRAKAFPENISTPILSLIHQLSRVAPNNKLWKRDVFDAFNDPRFFATPLPLLKSSWMPILAQWAHTDKERLPELLSRLSAPTTAGIMFGVGAASARQEADRKTQFTLRRIALLILAAPEDTFTPTLPQIQEKIVELLTATPATSPSSTTRAEVIILLRAIILKTSSIHLAPLWPIINGELTASLTSVLPDAENAGCYNSTGIIQACKLLDQLVVLDPDDFQLIEWGFVTDTIDAVYKPQMALTYAPSLTDEISEILSAAGSQSPTMGISVPQLHSSGGGGSGSGEAKRTLFLCPLIEALEKEEGAEVTDMARRELVDRVVRPFLGNLAIVRFEACYGGGGVDWEGVWGSVVADARGVE